MTDLMNSSEAREAFWHEGYMFVQGYLSVSTATLAARYALMQYRNQPRPEEDKDRPAQVPGAHSVYADPTWRRATSANWWDDTWFPPTPSIACIAPAIR